GAAARPGPGAKGLEAAQQWNLPCGEGGPRGGLGQAGEGGGGEGRDQGAVRDELAPREAGEQGLAHSPSPPARRRRSIRRRTKSALTNSSIPPIVVGMSTR